MVNPADRQAIKLAQEATRALSGVDAQQAMKLAREATGAFSGLDMRLVPSVAETFIGIDTKKLIDMTGVATAAKALEFAQPIVAPQVAEALKGIAVRMTPSFAEAFKGIGSMPAFNFAKTLGDLDVASAITPGVIDAMRGFSVPESVTASIAEALRGLPRMPATDLAPRFEAAAAEAVALAEVESVAEVVDAPVTAGWRSLPPAKRRTLALDLAALVVAFVALAAVLNEAVDPRAGAALACAAAVIRVYWRLDGKLD